MSFSVTVKGTPADVKAKLLEESGRLTDQSKEEFDAILPAMNTILDQQVGVTSVTLEANGHASFAAGEKTYGQAQVSIKVG